MMEGYQTAIGVPSNRVNFQLALSLKVAFWSRSTLIATSSPSISDCS
jgi:hypothetical protein